MFTVSQIKHLIYSFFFCFFCEAFEAISAKLSIFFLQNRKLKAKDEHTIPDYKCRYFFQIHKNGKI